MFCRFGIRGPKGNAFSPAYGMFFLGANEQIALALQVLYFVLMGGETFSEAQVIGYAVDDSEPYRCLCSFFFSGGGWGWRSKNNGHIFRGDNVHHCIIVNCNL